MINQTKIDECIPVVGGFKSKIEECLEITAPAGIEEVCKCLDDDALADLYESLKDCLIKDIQDAVKMSIKECMKPVTDCKKTQTKFLPLYKQCTITTEVPCGHPLNEGENVLLTKLITIRT